MDDLRFFKQGSEQGPENSFSSTGFQYCKILPGSRHDPVERSEAVLSEIIPHWRRS